MKSIADEAKAQRSNMYGRRIRGWLWQFCLVAALAAGVAYFGHNVAQNLAARHIPVGFSFLGERAGFDIDETLIEWNPNDTYGRVILVGVTNTLLVAAVSIALSTTLGLLVALMRLSSNQLFRGTGAGFVGLMRNVPQLLLVVFWYSVVLRSLPPPRESFSIGDIIFLNVRGLYLPEPVVLGGLAIAISVLIAVLGMALTSRQISRSTQRERKGYLRLLVCSAIFVVAAAIAFLGGARLSFNYPRLVGFNFIGGLRLFPEFVGLTVALSLSWAAYIGEIIRAGILSVDRGQIDAALGLGLKRGQVLRLVVIPQALQVIIPPLTSEYLSLTKATSLGVAVAYPELVTLFAGIVLSRTGQEIEVMFITMAVYLSISLVISMLMNFYNARIRLTGR